MSLSQPVRGSAGCRAPRRRVDPNKFNQPIQEITMSEPFLGEIRAVGFNFAPRGWAFCAGQQLSIAQNTALFSLLGTTFGGNGVTTFALPDYQGRSPVGMGNGPGLTPIVQGEVAGSESTTLNVTQMPMHTHTATAAQTGSDAAATAPGPAGNVSAITVLEDGRTQLSSFGAATATPVQMAPIPVTVQPSGGSQPLPLRNPFLGTNFIIALEGIFPSRP
jgi:microcystin-dependent protein